MATTITNPLKMLAKPLRARKPRIVLPAIALLGLLVLGAPAWGRKLGFCPLLAHTRSTASHVPTSYARSSKVIGESVLLGCPLVSAVQPPHITVQVVYYCALPLPFRHQAEFKFKIRVHNEGRVALNIELSHWRLLMRQFSPNQWSPPVLGPRTTERPYQVSYDGVKVWAVPADPNTAYDEDQRTGYKSFATHWEATLLAAGATYYRPHKYEGDITYYVPDTRSELNEVAGLAYVNDGRADVVVTPHNWQKRASAEEF